MKRTFPCHLEFTLINITFAQKIMNRVLKFVILPLLYCSAIPNIAETIVDKWKGDIETEMKDEKPNQGKVVYLDENKNIVVISDSVSSTVNMTIYKSGLPFYKDNDIVEPGKFMRYSVIDESDNGEYDVVVSINSNFYHLVFDNN